MIRRTSMQPVIAKSIEMVRKLTSLYVSGEVDQMPTAFLLIILVSCLLERKEFILEQCVSFFNSESVNPVSKYFLPGAFDLMEFSFY